MLRQALDRRGSGIALGGNQARGDLRQVITFVAASQLACERLAQIGLGTVGIGARRGFGLDRGGIVANGRRVGVDAV